MLPSSSNEEKNHNVRDDGRKTTERSSRQNPVEKAVKMENELTTAIMKRMYNLPLEEAGETRQRMANSVPKHTVQPADAPVGNSNTTENPSMEQEHKKTQFDVLLILEFNSYTELKEDDRKDKRKVGMRIRNLFGVKMNEFKQTNVFLDSAESRKEAYEYVQCRLEALRLRRADCSEGPSKGIEATKDSVEWKISEITGVLGRYAALMRDHLRWDSNTVEMLLMLKANTKDFNHLFLENYCLFTELA